MINPAMLLKYKQAKEAFVRNHPKFPQFFKRGKSGRSKSWYNHRN
jgi:hypothetical protein